MNRPILTLEEAKALPGVADLLKEGPVFLGIRGYFKNEYAGKELRGVYEDAAALIGPKDEFRTYNWNTMPSITQPGMAVLQSGTYKWTKGIHGQHHINKAIPADVLAMKWLEAHVGADHPDPKYRLTYWAFRQDSDMMVLRDGKTAPEIAPIDSYIDGHHGGLYGTSSEACQTVPVEQWLDMRNVGYHLMDVYNTKTINYHLIFQ